MIKMIKINILLKQEQYYQSILSSTTVLWSYCKVINYLATNNLISLNIIFLMSKGFL